MSGYVYDSGSSINSVRTKSYSVTPIADTAPRALLSAIDDEDDLIGDDVDDDIKDTIKEEDVDSELYENPNKPESILGESVNYSYSSSDVNAVNHVDSNKKKFTVIEFSKNDLFGSMDDDIVELERGDMEEILSVKSKKTDNKPNEELLTERALSSKVRDKLSDDLFGLPEMRMYPIHDRKHVNQAIRFFNKVTDAKDQKVLANNIVKQYRKFNMKTKISKINKLYDFVPDEMRQKPLNEASSEAIKEFSLSNAASTIDNKLYVPVYVVLTSNKTPMGNAIRKVTDAAYSHAGIAFDHTLNTIYSFNVEGFVVESINDGPLGKLVEVGSKYTLYVTFILKDRAKIIEDHIKNLMENKNKTRYNASGLIKYLLKIPSKEYNEYHQFCSEFVANMFKFVDDSIVKTDASLTSPIDIINNSTKFAYVSKGLLKKYSPRNTLTKLQKIIISKKVHNYLVENSIFYNNLFYNIDLSNCISAIKEFNIFDYFYPSVKYGLINQIRSSIGGLYLSMDIKDISNTSELAALLLSIYNRNDNRYKVSTDISINDDSSIDYTHVVYCRKLYDIVDRMLHKGVYRLDQLSTEDRSIISDWRHLVDYHYSIYNDETISNYEKTIQQQYLYDLLWDYHDDINDPYVVNSNIFGFLYELNHVKPILENSDLINPEDMYAYLKNEVLPDDITFLIPSEMKYPILDKQSVHMAMDIINSIESEYRIEYVSRLNRAYDIFNCDFLIPINHPYAKYVPKEMIDPRIYSLNSSFGSQSTNSDIQVQPKPREVSIVENVNPHEYNEALIRKTIDIFKKFL